MLRSQERPSGGDGSAPALASAGAAGQQVHVGSAGSSVPEHLTAPELLPEGLLSWPDAPLVLNTREAHDLPVRAHAPRRDARDWPRRVTAVNRESRVSLLVMLCQPAGNLRMKRLPEPSTEAQCKCMYSVLPAWRLAVHVSCGSRSVHFWVCALCCMQAVQPVSHVPGWCGSVPYVYGGKQFEGTMHA